MRVFVTRFITVVTAIWIAVSAAESTHSHCANTTCQVCLAQITSRRRSLSALAGMEDRAIGATDLPPTSLVEEGVFEGLPDIVVDLSPVVIWPEIETEGNRDVTGTASFVFLESSFATGPPRGPPHV